MDNNRLNTIGSWEYLNDRFLEIIPNFNGFEDSVFEDSSHHSFIYYPLFIVKSIFYFIIYNRKWTTFTNGYFWWLIVVLTTTAFQLEWNFAVCIILKIRISIVLIFLHHKLLQVVFRVLYLVQNVCSHYSLGH